MSDALKLGRVEVAHVAVVALVGLEGLVVASQWTDLKPVHLANALRVRRRLTRC